MPTDLEQAKQQLAQARAALDSILEANRRDGVWNEHVLHSESTAKELVARYATAVARLTRDSVRDGMGAQNRGEAAQSDSALHGNSAGDRAKQM